MNAEARRRALVLAVGTTLLGLFVFSRFRLETSILAFLPRDSQAISKVSTALADSQAARSMIFSVDAKEPSVEARRDGARVLAAKLASLPGVREVFRGPSGEEGDRVFSALHPRRFDFLSEDPERELPAAYGSREDALARARELLGALAVEEGGLVRRLLPSDPWGVSEKRLGEWSRTFPGAPRVAGDQLVASSGEALLFLEFEGSSFDGEVQRALLDAVERAVAETEAELEGIKIEFTGVNRFAVVAERETKEDISRISTLSTAILLGLYVALFRRPSRLLFPLLPIVTGSLAGIAASLLVFGQVHALTLAFGSSLIGVAIDFPVHLIAHHDLGPTGERPGEALRGIARSLLLAGGTTILGFSALGFSGYPGLTEMSVFAGVGVTVGLLSVVIGAPLLGASVPPTRTLRWVASGLARLVSSLGGHRSALAIPVLVALGIAALGLTRARFEEKLGALNNPPPELAAEDRRVRARAGEEPEGRTLVTFGADLESALVRLESLRRELGSAGVERSSFHDLGRFVWSESLRRRNRAVLERDPSLARTTLEALSEVGFERSAFAEFEAGLVPTPPPSAEALLASFPERWTRPYVLRIPGGVALFTHVSEAGAARAARALERLPHTVEYPRDEALGALFASVTRRTLGVLSGGFALVALVVFLRYRSLRKTASALVGPLLASATTLGVLSLFGVELTLLHGLALLLVLSMGEDYGIFLVDAFETGLRASEQAALVSICLASVSTIVSFGLLALSSLPALRALGTTVAVGDFLSLVFAPTSLLLFERRTR